jgi:predicted nucleotide-binding protein (sugar kinase/HSP70/actin superfamily)
MSSHHMPFIINAFNSSGYNVVYLPEMNEYMVDTGLKYVNNDACYPSIIVIGQIINALQSGRYDLENTSVVISQTGGGCRATNYIGLIRKAVKDAGFDVPIISFNFNGLEKEQAFKVTLPIINKLLMGVIYGDLLMKLLHETRPYEINKGDSITLYREFYERCYYATGRGKKSEFNSLTSEIIERFNNVPVKLGDKIKVGIVGEILIKYHRFGNRNLVDKLEAEGAVTSVPDLMGFVKYCAHNAITKSKLLKTSKITANLYRIALDIINLYEKNVKNKLAKTRYRNVTDIEHLAKNVQPILSTGNQTGEGWFLTAEMVELIKEGVTNIICVQPFACLPNHIVGKAVIKRIRELYPESNIVAIDYDPGASESNQINRIKLMLSIARDNNAKNKG